MKEITAFEADDGTVFTVAKDCRLHEARQQAAQDIIASCQADDIRNINVYNDVAEMLDSRWGRGIYEALHKVYGYSHE